MLFGLEQSDDGNNWTVRYPGRTPRRFRATFDEVVLELEYANGLWLYWDKLFPDPLEFR